MQLLLRRAIGAIGTAAVLWSCSSSDGTTAQSGPGAPDGGPGAEGGPSTSASDASDAPATCQADLATDPKNCGRCAHDCLGGACAAGRCQPVLLSSLVTRNEQIATDGTYVYSVNSIACPNRLPVSGGASSGAGCASGTVHRIAVDDTAIFLLTSGTSTEVIYRLDKITKTSTLVTDLGGSVALGFALDGNSVNWWTPFNDPVAPKRLFVAPKTGGPSVALTAAGVFDGNHAVARGGFVYGADPTTSHLIRVSSSKTITVLSQDAAPGFMTINDTTLAWFDYRDDGLYAMPLAGGSPTRLGTDTPGLVMGMQMDDTTVYWVDYQTLAIKAQPLAGGPSSVLYAPVPDLGNFVMDATALYYTDDKGLERLAK